MWKRRLAEKSEELVDMSGGAPNQSFLANTRNSPNHYRKGQYTTVWSCFLIESGCFIGPVGVGF